MIRKIFLTINRPYICACCSCHPLNVKISGVDYIVTIIECKTTLYFFNKANNWKWKFTGSYCQC